MEYKKNKKLTYLIIFIIAIAIIIAASYKFIIMPTIKYNNAVAMLNNGEYKKAIVEFEQLGSFKDSPIQLEAAIAKQQESDYQEGLTALDNNNYRSATSLFSNCTGYKDADLYLAYATVGVYYDNLSNESSSSTIDASKFMGYYAKLI